MILQQILGSRLSYESLEYRVQWTISSLFCQSAYKEGQFSLKEILDKEEIKIKSIFLQFNGSECK